MAQLKLSEDIRPLSDLRDQPSQVVDQALATGRPVVLTREGRGVAVLLAVDAYEELQGAAARAELQRAVDDAEEDLAAGHWVEHSEVMAKLERWANGAG